MVQCQNRQNGRHPVQRTVRLPALGAVEGKKPSTGARLKRFVSQAKMQRLTQGSCGRVEPPPRPRVTQLPHGPARLHGAQHRRIVWQAVLEAHARMSLMPAMIAVSGVFKMPRNSVQMQMPRALLRPQGLGVRCQRTQTQHRTKIEKSRTHALCRHCPL